MKKICFMLNEDAPRSGITKVVVNIANLLAAEREDYEIHILCIKALSGKLTSLLHEKVKLDSMNIGRKNKFKFYAGAAMGIKRYLRATQIQVLIISGMEWVLPLFIGTRGDKGGKFKVSMIAWEHLCFGAEPRFRRAWIAKWLACRYFDGIINITKKDNMLYQRYSSTARLFQIYNICRLDKFYEQGRQNYDLYSKKIISVGYLDPIKGYDMLIKVAAKVLPKYPDWSWDIYGEGRMHTQLQDEIVSADLQQQLHLKGYREDVGELYHDYSFFVMTSRLEGFGMVLVEAQKNMLPIVSFDIPCGPSDTVENGKNGFLVSPFDIEKMADRITELICNSELRKNFAEHAQDFHEEMCSDYILKKWQNMLDYIGDKNDIEDS